MGLQRVRHDLVAEQQEQGSVMYVSFSQPKGPLLPLLRPVIITLLVMLVSPVFQILFFLVLLTSCIINTRQH